MERGLGDPDLIKKYRLGYVNEPLPGHEQYKGMLSIPYLRYPKPGVEIVISIRFRCIEDHDHKVESHGKYATVAGDTPRLYNTAALQLSDNVIGITEGELDAISVSHHGIVRAVGVPGVQSWKSHFAEPFLGYGTVFIFADGDEPGKKFAASLRPKLPNSRIIAMPDGEDAGSFIHKYGAEALREKLK